MYRSPASPPTGLSSIDLPADGKPSGRDPSLSDATSLVADDICRDELWIVAVC
ncbi:MAG: hypothetical protein HGB32_03630 [Geobacteraceae bacterium]|nr:hypothetical protein [Geobacteraceae bacterium]NTW79223.1 hypothetical protein [Geobacteraceae bacterium]